MKFIDCYISSGTICRLPVSGRQLRITDEVTKVVEEAMQLDDKTTVCQLHVILTQQGYTLSLSTILHCRSLLDWTFHGSAYCQVICKVNKAKRLEWCRNNLENDFADVVFTNKYSIQMETHRRFCCQKSGEPPKNKPRYMYMLYVLATILCIAIAKRLVTCTCVYNVKSPLFFFYSLMETSY